MGMLSLSNQGVETLGQVTGSVQRILSFNKSLKSEVLPARNMQ
jgi:hypothetical protein